ncbi:MAG: hypothetical protein ACYC0H_15805 [Solirubrobacteraceae bacterium]
MIVNGAHDLRAIADNLVVAPEQHLGDDVTPGTRVRVIQDPEWPGPWEQEFAGTVVGLRVPVRVIDLTAMPEVNVPDADRGPMREFHVQFDQPQRDSDGHGPYKAAVIWEKYLRRVD